MMGCFRLVLALVVMQAHATEPGNHYALANTAVLIFYALSSYGCTAAMQGKYKGQPLLFMGSRYLRLWPSYLATFALSSVAWVAFDDLYKITMPTGLAWWGHLLMVYHPPGRLIAPAWVLPWMLLGYVVITFGASGTARRSLAWLAVSFAWAQHQAFLLSWGEYYGSAAAWSLAYSVGAAAYWMPVEVPRASGWAGVIAFPIFLSHYLVLSVLRSLGLIPGWPLFFVALPPTLALSWLLVVAVERPIARYRQSLRRTP